MFPGGCGPATLEHFEKSKMAANWENNAIYSRHKVYLMLQKQFFLMIQIDVHAREKGIKVKSQETYCSAQKSELLQ